MDKMDNNYIKKINLIKNNFKFNIRELDFESFTISKIDINTELPYYIVKVLYTEKNMNEKIKQLFSEYILEKNNNKILHCFTNNILITNNNDVKVEEKIESKDTLKIFYYENNWNNISNLKDIILKKIFNNINDFYEILNKDFYYTYIIKDEKLIFIDKCKKSNINTKYNNDEIYDIILDDNKYILSKNIKNNTEKEKCKYGLKCIKPNCYYEHPKEYNLNESYKKYIIEERIKNPMFKSLNCKNDDSSCIKHKDNKCKFLHKNDPVD